MIMWTHKISCLTVLFLSPGLLLMDDCAFAEMISLAVMN